MRECIIYGVPTKHWLSFYPRTFMAFQSRIKGPGRRPQHSCTSVWLRCSDTKNKIHVLVYSTHVLHAFKFVEKASFLWQRITDVQSN